MDANCVCSAPAVRRSTPEDALMNTRLEKFYKEEVVPALMKQFGYTNPMQVPKLVKVTLNMGVGEAATNKKILENAVADMAKVSGQKPIVTKSRVSVASFKIRDGWPIGCKTTLRREKMYEFLDRLINISLPRVRDFRGVSGRSFDGRGNFNMGVKEQIIFPEIDFDAVDAIRGMDIAITTTAKTDAEAKALLAAFKFPFRN
jgi:large subunit ribosomal protein L5